MSDQLDPGDSLILFTDGVGNIHEQRARSRAGVVHLYAPYGPDYHNGGHDAGHGVRRVVFGVLAAAVAVVIFNEVFENGREEIKLLFKDPLKAEIH